MSLLKAFTTRNVGTLDRVIRTFPTVIVAYLYFAGLISGWLGMVLSILALMAAVDEYLGFLLYLLFPGIFHLPTLEKKQAKKL